MNVSLYPFFLTVHDFFGFHKYTSNSESQFLALVGRTDKGTPQRVVCSYSIRGEQSGTGTGFSPSSSVFPVNIITPLIHIV
jgi:hypothetical protein